MLTVQVRLLAGRYVASQYNDRDRVEWPPHPMRLFAAAVAAWADADAPDPAEREALEWWESLGAPEVTCSEIDDVAERTAVTHYVPVNDASVLTRDAADAYRRLEVALQEQVAAREAGGKAAQRSVREAEGAERKARAAAAALAQGRPAPQSALEVLPMNRVRQARTYPSAVPPDEVVTYRWPDADTADSSAVVALDAVLARIARLGHSSSPVDVAVVQSFDEAEATYMPADGGELILRTAQPGQLAALEDAYQMHEGREPRILPSSSMTYRRGSAEAAPMPWTVFEATDWLLFEPQTRRPIAETLILTRALRAALLVHADQPPPAILTGHRAGPPGEPTEPTADPHAAYLALPFVGAPHGDGSIQALAVVLPRAVSDPDRSAVARAAACWLAQSGRLTFGRGGVLEVEAVDSDQAAHSARPVTWTSPSRRWSTATPVALDRHPGRLDPADPRRREEAVRVATESIVQACHNVGLPAPDTVTVRTDPPIRGTRPTRSFAVFAVNGGRLRRMLVHVDLAFGERVRGPLILGAGRFFGYGLFRPMDGYADA